MLGTLPGGLAHINIVAAMLFGAISGSAAAAATAVGGTMGPRMKEAGYDTGFSVAANVTSSTTGLIIPPSNSLIVYSLASGGVSIGALFLAGYGPGLLLGLLLMVTASVIAVRRKYPTSGRVGFGEMARRFVDALPSLFLLFVVMGGIVAGVFTATEAAAVAVLYALLLSLLYREFGLRDLPDILLESVVTTSIVLILIGTSMGLSWILAYINLPQELTAALVGFSTHPAGILLLMNLLLLVVGMFMDLTPAVLIFTPILLPVAIELGIDPVHFGIIMVLNLSIGLCSPPVGSLLFIGVSVGETTIAKVVRPMLPFYLAMIVSLIVVSLVPQLSLWLPGAFGF
jgi:tripartite ATP-independent transporter DctM subunit